MKPALVPLLRCAACWASSLELVSFEVSDTDRCRTGVLICAACSNWYPVEDFILELLPIDLERPRRRSDFYERHRRAMEELGAEQPAVTHPSPADTAQERQRRYFDQWASREDDSYSDFAEQPFQRAHRDLIFGTWRPMLAAGSTVLDVGCGDGVSSFDIAAEGIEVVAFDISREQIARAIRRAESAGRRNLTFFVADADTIPVADEAVDCLLCFGTLHHLPDPARTLSEAARVLKPGGLYLGIENNKTPLRPAFDLLMRLNPLWTEEAGEEAQMGMEELESWTAGIGLRLWLRPNVFVPPHLCNRLGVERARRLLRRSDAIMGSVPALRRWGGLIEIVGRRQAAPRVPEPKSGGG